MKTMLNDIRPQLQKIFAYLHQNPEVSWREVNTTRYVQSILESLGCRVRVFDECTGVVGEIGEGGPIIALRADMDALWQEVDGRFRANHSCGHDAHMTMALGVLLLLKKLVRPQTMPGTLRLIFQPAEEQGTGALKMVELGVAEDVDFLYGVHLRPEQELSNGKAAPSIRHGAAQFYTGRIKGEDAHGARPHLGKSAIRVGADLVRMLDGIQLNPSIPHSAKLTRFNTGEGSPNIIAGSAEFAMDLRAQTNATMNELERKVIHAVNALAELHGIEIQLDQGTRVAAAEVDSEAESFMAQAISDVLSGENLAGPLTTTGGDDFHFYTLERPHIKATMLGLGCGLSPGLHHPQMTFDQEALFTGVEILTKAILYTWEGNQGDR